VKRITSSSVSCSVCRIMRWAPHDCRRQTGGAGETEQHMDACRAADTPSLAGCACLAVLASKLEAPSNESLPRPTHLGHFHLLLCGGGAYHLRACSTRHLQVGGEAGRQNWAEVPGFLLVCSGGGRQGKAAALQAEGMWRSIHPALACVISCPVPPAAACTSTVSPAWMG